MRQLKGLIAKHVIHAVFLYHPDRAPDKPAHRLLLRAMCEATFPFDVATAKSPMGTWAR